MHINRLKLHKSVLCIISLILIAVILCSATLAWYIGKTSVPLEPIAGTILRQYFHCGTGTEDDPFVITRPIHYYHLVELYQRVPEFSSGDYYFQLGYDLEGNNDGILDPGETWLVYDYYDSGSPTGGTAASLNLASYSGSNALLPVGTSDIPFNGTFNGNDLTIRNLNIKAQETINDGLFGTADIGIFGYLGSEADIGNVYYKDVTIDLRGLSTDNIESEVHNASVHSASGNNVAYVGYIAGHVTTSTSCNDVYVNDCTILGGDAATCGFGYFGCVEDASTGSTVVSLGSEVATLRGRGNEAGFGGSINMSELFSRVRNVLSLSSHTAYRYVTEKTVVVDEVAGTTRVTSLTRDGSLTSMNSNYKGYYVEHGGNYIFYDRSSNEYTYMSSTTADQTIEVTTYTYKDEYTDAWYIRDGSNYLSVSDTALSGSSTQSDAAKWIFDDDGHLYTIIDGESYFLVFNGTAGVTLSAGLSKTASAVWSRTENNELKTTVNGVDYYLDYNAGWVVTSLYESFRISDGNGNYLSAGASGVTNVSSADDSVKWLVSNPGGNTTFSTVTDGSVYYLNGDGAGLSVSTSSMTWTKESDSYYTTIQGIKYYLVCENGVWKLLPESGKKLSDGSGHYLTATETGTGTANLSDTVIWQFSNENGDTQIYTVINSQKYYLTYSNGLTVSTAAATWHRSGDSFYLTSGNTDLYLTYDNGWTAIPLQYYLIHDMNSNYLVVSGADNFGNATAESDATHFYFTAAGTNPSGMIYCTVNGNSYYLYNNGGTLSTATDSSSATSWSNDGNSIYCTSGSTVYALGYDNGWGLRTINNGYLIKSGDTFLALNGQTLTYTTDESRATVFEFSNTAGNPSGTVRAVGTGYYLYNNNGTLQASSSSTSWSNDGTSLYVTSGNTTYALSYDAANRWHLATIISGQVIWNGDDADPHYLMITGTGTSSYSSTSNINEATLFTFSGSNNTGNIYTTYNGTTVYLRNNSGSFELYTGNGNNGKTSWNYDGNNFINNRYYLAYIGGWRLTQNTSPVTYTIRYGDNYLNTDGTSGLANGTSADTATRWTFSNTGNNPSGTISTEINGTTYYLVGSRSREYLILGDYVYTLSLTTYSRNATSWSNSSGKLTGSNVGIRYSNGWIGDSTGNATALTITQDPNVPHYSRVKTLDTALPAVDTVQKQTSLPAAGVAQRTETAPVISVSDYLLPSAGIALTGPIVEDYALDYTATTQQIVVKTVTTERTGTYFPLRLAVSGDADYDPGNIYKTSQKNTGYIVSGSYQTETSSNYHSDIRISRYDKAEIGDSYLNNQFTTIYTFDGTSNTVHALSSAQMNTPAFQSASAQLLETLNGNNTYVYGLHFMNSEISMNHIILADEATVLGKTYYNYELPEDSIDFTVVERGTINFFAGEYFGGNTAFFSLHQVFRDTNKHITAIKEIKKVYATSRGVADRYVYLYSDNSYYDGVNWYQELPSGYEQVFDTDWITNPNGVNSNNSKLYYFEIPCNMGEYCLGSVSGKSGAYLIYLDIATNGGEVIQSVISSEGNAVADRFAVEHRYAPDTVDYALLQFSIKAPEVANQNDFSVTMHFDDSDSGGGVYPGGLYTLTIVNNSGTDLELYVFMCDDDDDAFNTYPYAYKIIYSNASNTETVLTNAISSSDCWKSAGGYIIPSTGSAEEMTYSA